MDKPCNSSSDITRVYNWEDIYNFISSYRDDRLNVILDTDTYNECDDQFALAYLLKPQDKFKINAITVAPFFHKDNNVTTKDSQDLSYKEVVNISNMLNFITDSRAFRGSTGYISNGYNEENNAVKKIIEIALNNGKTYIMATGL